MFFILHLYCHHQALPSFPTRRSSDLDPDQVLGRGRVQLAKKGGEEVELRLQAAFAAGARYLPQTPVHVDDSRRARSEEHTSELQSRQYLVCRLLLEKKKNHKTLDSRR